MKMIFMKGTLRNLPKVKSVNVVAVVYKMLPSTLSNVPFHSNTIAITRYFAEHFPVQLAVHKVSPVINSPPEYTLHIFPMKAMRSILLLPGIN
jgi:hypothetical protein